jgi:uncharacterized membrane protein (Fun14 family)
VGGGPRSGDPSAGGQAAAGAEAGAEEGAAGGWSPLFLKGGLSFFVGFCLGAVLRAFLKISAIVLGLVFLAVFGLSYAGLIPAIDWSAMEGHFNRIVASLSEQASSFKTFIAGNLPSAGMLGLGLFTGLKKS